MDTTIDALRCTCQREAKCLTFGEPGGRSCRSMVASKAADASESELVPWSPTAHMNQSRT